MGKVNQFAKILPWCSTTGKLYLTNDDHTIYLVDGHPVEDDRYLKVNELGIVYPSKEIITMTDEVSHTTTYSNDSNIEYCRIVNDLVALPYTSTDIAGVRNNVPISLTKVVLVFNSDYDIDGNHKWDDIYKFEVILNNGDLTIDTVSIEKEMFMSGDVIEMPIAKGSYNNLSITINSYKNNTLIESILNIPQILLYYNLGSSLL